MNVDIWVVGSSNQLFIRGSYTETKLIKLAKSSLYTYIYIYTFIYIYINVFYATNITRINLTQSLI